MPSATGLWHLSCDRALSMGRRRPTSHVSTGQLARDRRLNSLPTSPRVPNRRLQLRDNSSARQETCTIAPAATKRSQGAHGLQPAIPRVCVFAGRRSPAAPAASGGRPRASPPRVSGGRGHPGWPPRARSPRLPGEGGGARRPHHGRPRRSPSLCAAAARRLRTGPRARGGTRLCVCARMCVSVCVSVRE